MTLPMWVVVLGAAWIVVSVLCLPGIMRSSRFERNSRIEAWREVDKALAENEALQDRLALEDKHRKIVELAYVAALERGARVWQMWGDYEEKRREAKE